METCAKTIKGDNTRKSEDSKKFLQRQMIMDGGEGKKLKNCCVVENIEPQKKLRECDEIKENEKKCSPMSKTTSKQVSNE